MTKSDLETCLSVAVGLCVLWLLLLCMDLVTDDGDDSEPPPP